MNGTGIWAALGIERTDDERAIKRAYATRLKSDRASLDAPRFIALREAYEAALQEARGAGTPPAPHGVAVPARPSPAAPVEAAAPPPSGTSPPESDLSVAPPQAMPAPRGRSRHPTRPEPRTDEERQHRARASAPRLHNIRSLLNELQEALSRQAGPGELLHLLRRVLAHRDVQRFSSRDHAELELVEIVTTHAYASRPLIAPLCLEFGWDRDEMSLTRRFPLRAPALLMLLSAAAGSTPSGPAAPPKAVPRPEPRAFGRTAREWMDASPWLRWWILVFWHAGRRSIAALLTADDIEGGPTPACQRWWHLSLRAVPPLNRSLSFAAAALVMLSSLRQLPFELTHDVGHFIIERFTVAVGAVAATWLCITWPHHLVRSSSLSYATSWPWIAGTAWLAAVALREDPMALPALVGISLLLAVGSVLLHLKGNLFVLFMLFWLTVMPLVSIGMDALQAGPPSVLQLTAAMLPFVMVVITAEQARLPTLLGSPLRLALGALPSLVVLVLSFAPIGETLLSVAVLGALLIGHGLAPLPSPRWTSRFASIGWVARHVPHAAPGLRLLNLLLWCTLATLLMKSVYPGPEPVAAGMGLLIVRGLALAAVLPGRDRRAD